MPQARRESCELVDLMGAFQAMRRIIDRAEQIDINDDIGLRRFKKEFSRLVVMCDLIRRTPPRTWADAAAKLRLACDKDLGLPSILDAAQPELLNIQQVLAFAERQVTV